MAPRSGYAAYEDRAQAIGHGQTISQPYLVAMMTQLSDAGPGRRVLEIGTGSGYQAAVLAEVGAEVFSIEIVDALGGRLVVPVGGRSQALVVVTRTETGFAERRVFGVRFVPMTSRRRES